MDWAGEIFATVKLLLYHVSGNAHCIAVVCGKRKASASFVSWVHLYADAVRSV